MMTITTKLAVAIACATLAACGTADETNNVETLDVNTLVTDNVGTTDMNMDMNATDMNAMNMDMNATGNDMNATDANTTTNTL